mmetsp:Transcript_37223/g.109895  ORF Transcript_37223/g.109895 Transcript_37223/m.109895 type:complete len:261 (-) Transcript_37223:1276-2058(-)
MCRTTSTMRRSKMQRRGCGQRSCLPCTWKMLLRTTRRPKRRCGRSARRGVWRWRPRAPTLANSVSAWRKPSGSCRRRLGMPQARARGVPVPRQARKAGAPTATQRAVPPPARTPPRPHPLRCCRRRLLCSWRRSRKALSLRSSRSKLSARWRPLPTPHARPRGWRASRSAKTRRLSASARCCATLMASATTPLGRSSGRRLTGSPSTARCGGVKAGHGGCTSITFLTWRRVVEGSSMRRKGVWGCEEGGTRVCTRTACWS